MPVTEHSAAILAGSWPSQSVMAWSGYSMAYSQAANSLFLQLDAQMDIKEALAGMDGAFIESARSLVQSRETALQNRIDAYRHISKKAKWAASELQATKTDLADIVNTAEQAITTSRQNAEKAKAAAAAIPGAAAMIEAQLQAAIADIVSTAKADAQRRDLQGATTVTALSNEIAEWAAPYANSILPQAGGAPDMGNLPASPAPASPAPAAPPQNTKPVDYKTDAVDPNRLSDGQQNAAKDSQVDQSQKNIQQTAMRSDHDAVKDGAAQAGKPSPPVSSAPSSPSSGGSSSGGGSPASSIAQMMRPASSGTSSPASSSPASSSSGATNPAGAAQSSQMANAKPGAVPATGANAATGAGAAARAPGLASLGSGIAESSARMASGAVNTASNVASGAANVGGNVAQNVAQAAAQAPAAAASPAASTMPAAAAPAAGGGAPMAMMPPAGAAGAGPAVINPVTGSPNVGGGPGASPAAGTTPVSAAGGVAPPAASGSSLAPAPVSVHGPGVRGVGAGGTSGDVLFEQAMDAGRDVISAMVAQTLASGHITVHYAVTLVYERGGTVSAWMATSEGASYIPLGVRVPRDVRLSVTDPAVGQELWEASAAAGGANPLEIVVQQAQAREMAAPGGRVLAIASSLPIGQVIDWAGEVRARPVSVEPKTLAPITAPDMAMAHRCAVAMPWEWRQANQFSEQDRLRIAARQMYMAVTEGHLSSGAAEKVIDLFESRQPIGEALWKDVDRARLMSLVEYELAMKSAGQGGAEPARALASARAAEVILCLRNAATAEGCADLLYASRLAGAPLNPAAAVA